MDGIERVVECFESRIFKINQIESTGFLAHKHMLQRKPIAFTQLIAGNTSELNDNTKMNTIFMNSEKK